MSNMNISDNLRALYLTFQDELPDSDQQCGALDEFIAMTDSMKNAGVITADQNGELQDAMYHCASTAHEDGFYLGWKIALTLLRETSELGVVKPDKED